MAIQVYYNNNLIGAPFVSKSFAPLDYGNRWGMTESVTLNGYIDAIDGVQTQTKQDHLGNSFTEMTTGEAVGFNEIFKQNFKSLKVYDDNVLVDEYSIDSCLVEEVSFESSKWQQKTPIKYTVKLKAYDVYNVDAVVDPSDNWDYTESEDGSVSVVHKISAKGIKSGTASALSRAITFVDKYSRLQPNPPAWSEPVMAASFAGNTPLLSKSESVNRLEGTYSVTENYKYYPNDEFAHESCVECHSDAWITAAGGPYANEDACRAAFGCKPEAQSHVLRNYKMTQSNSLGEDFPTVDFEVEYRGEVIDTNMDHLRANVDTDMTANSYIFEKRIASELLPAAAPAAIDANYIYVYQNSMSISEDEPGHTISVKVQYQTGYNNLTTGFLDWKVDMNLDNVTAVATYQINGEYISYGNIVSKRKKIKDFKDLYYDNSNSNIQHYLYGLLSTQSQMFKSWGNKSCAECDDNDYQTDANNPAEFTTLDGCREFYNCSRRVINPFPKSIKWSENIDLATLNVSAEFNDEDYHPNVANLKWSVGETSTKYLAKEQPSANVDGVYALQLLNCSTAQNTKITVNGDRQHVIGHSTASSSPVEMDTPDHFAHTAIRTVADQVAALAIPKDAGAYDKSIPPGNFSKELVDESDDGSFPYTFSANRSYLHTPTLDNFSVFDHLWSSGASSVVGGGTNFQRGKGYKFGY